MTATLEWCQANSLRKFHAGGIGAERQSRPQVVFRERSPRRGYPANVWPAITEALPGSSRLVAVKNARREKESREHGLP